MAISPIHEQKNRDNASLHLVITDIVLTYPADPISTEYGPDTRIDISGKVETVFRGQDLVRIGDSIKFRAYIWKDDWPETLGGYYINYNLLVRARRIEAYFDGIPPDMSVVGYLKLIEY